MNRARLLAVGAVVAGALLLVSGVGAYEGIAADRQSSVQVSSPDDSLLGISGPSTIRVDNGRHARTLLRLDNRASTPLTSVAVDLTDPSPTPPLVKDRWVVAPDRIDVGQSAPVSASIVCGNVTDPVESVPVSITVSGGATRIETTRTVRIVCTGN